MKESEDVLPIAFASRIEEGQSSSIVLWSSSERKNIRDEHDKEFHEALSLD